MILGVVRRRHGRRERRDISHGTHFAIKLELRETIDPRRPAVVGVVVARLRRLDVIG